MKLFPSPRIPTDKIPECQPHIKRGEHLKLYRFSPSEFAEIKSVFNGPPTGVAANNGDGEGVVDKVKDAVS